MSNSAFTKVERRELQRLGGVAHERELSSAAAQLQSGFDQWRSGKKDVFELNEQIHKFHDGVSRELYKQYVMGEASWNVASAIARGILNESEVTPALIEKLRRGIDCAKEWIKDEKE